MSLDTELRTLALTNNDVVAQIGARYHIDNLPDNVSYPCVRAVTITDPSHRTHAGTYGGTETVQLDVYGSTQATRDAAADALIEWLDNYTGSMGDWDVTIQVRNKPRSWEPEARLYRTMLELSILYLQV